LAGFFFAGTDIEHVAVEWKNGVGLFAVGAKRTFQHAFASALFRFAGLWKRQPPTLAGGDLASMPGAVMTFLWPEMLWLLLVVPALAAAYLSLLRRRKRLAQRYANLTMVREAMGNGARIRRNVPPLLFLLALTLMLIAIARPVALITLPSRYDTVILAIDISTSMRAGDIAPSRIEAAQEAARSFIAEQPPDTRVGVVTFAGTAAVAQPPTLNRQDILAALDKLQLENWTAVGSGILVSLKLIFPELLLDLTASDPRPGALRDASREVATDAAPTAKIPGLVAMQPGSDTSAAIILLTDGETNAGPDPVKAARIAAERGIRVFTVGIGTHDGEISQGGLSTKAGLDEKTLQEIAAVTHAEYFYGGTALDLTNIYKQLSSKLVMEKKKNELTATFAIAAALMAILSAVFSMLWFNRIL
jgi:Ca-activated chloride channel homolog